MAAALRALGGHLRTVGHLAGNRLRPPPAPPSVGWRTELLDPVSGRVPVTGRLARAGDGALLAILVHGLGGSAESHYLRHAARVASSLGIDSLRLNLRGADPVAGDFYHAALTAELHAAVGDPGLAGYRTILVLGYSMGGHLALRYAAEVDDPRVVAVTAVCSPLHLRPVSEAFEDAGRRLYCRYVLGHLRRSFRELERTGARLPRPFAEIRGARTFRRWDALTVVPRFGFVDPDDYYDRASAEAVLDRLRVPCLLVASEADPLIPPRAIAPFLPADAAVQRLDGRRPPAPAATAAACQLTVLWHPAAGHVAFPRRLDLGEQMPPGLESQLLGWGLRCAVSTGPDAAVPDRGAAPPPC